MDSSGTIPPDFAARLKNLALETDAIIESSFKPMTAQEPPPIIYHYTNDVGLKGILEAGQIWLTDIFNLNDPSEIRHGFDLALKILNGKAEDGTPEIKNIAYLLSAFSEQIHESGLYFICSLSCMGNDLGQWRAYADNGRGYALGFDAGSLRTGFTKEAPPQSTCDTFLITYKDARLKEIQSAIIEKAISMPSSGALENAVIQSYLAELGTLLTTRLIVAGLYFKHEAYENEKEYRFLQVFNKLSQVPGLKLRSGPYSLVKYREFDWRSAAPGALKKIIVGPAADYEKASRFAKDCLRLFNKGDVEEVTVSRSGIPYRV